MALLTAFEFYADYPLSELRRHGSQASSNESLQQGVSSVFSLLRNWRDKRARRDRFEFVIAGLRAAFPDMFEDLDFETAGSTVTIKIYGPDSDKGIPIEVVANGFLVALLHLCAVASMPKGGVIAIDEPENGLHPFAISELLDAMAARAQARDLTILLATHSPAVLNWFNRKPNQVYVMEPGLVPTPIALDKHRSPEWLAHFSLGDLFLDHEYSSLNAG